MTQIDECEQKEIQIEELARGVAGVCLCTRVRQLSRIITKLYDAAMRPFGITASQYTLLTRIARRDGITQVEINAILDIEKSTNARNFKRLVANGLITMDPPAGRRGRKTHLTPKGKVVIKEAYPAWKWAQLEIVAAIGHDGRHAIDKLLVQLAKPE